MATQEETREEKLFRILRSGLSGPEDWPEAMYLVDNGFATAKVLRSRMSSTWGEALDIQRFEPRPGAIERAVALWAPGQSRDLEILQEPPDQCIRNQDHREKQPVVDVETKTANAKDERPWDEKPLGKIALQLAGAALFAALLWALSI